MSALGEALGNAAPPHELITPTKTYHVKLVDDGVKVAIEKRLYARAREHLREMKSEYSHDEYIELLHLLGLDYQTGEFSLESERGRNYLLSKSGQIHLMSLCFGCEEAEMIRLVLKHGDEVNSLITLVLEESFPGAATGVKEEGKKEDPSPNAEWGEKNLLSPQQTKPPALPASKPRPW